MTVHFDISLWPVLFAVMFFTLLPLAREIMDRLAPRPPDGASLKALADRIGNLELAAGMKRNG